MTKPSKVFATDVDGVLLDIFQPFYRYMKETYNVTISPLDQRWWDAMDYFGLGQREQDKIWELIWSKPAILRPLGVTFLAQLRELGWKVVGVSLRKEGPAKEAAERDFPSYFDDWICVNHYMDKSSKVRKLGSPYFIEDRPRNAIHVAEYTEAKVWLVTRPWNQGFIDLNNRVEVAHDLDHIWRSLVHG